MALPYIAWSRRKIFSPIVSISRKAYSQAAPNAIWFDMRLIHSIADQDMCEKNGSGREQSRALNL